MNVEKHLIYHIHIEVLQVPRLVQQKSSKCLPMFLLTHELMAGIEQSEGFVKKIHLRKSRPVEA